MFAVLVDNTGFSEVNYDLFLALNDEPDKGKEVSLLYLNLSNNIMPNDFPIMNITEMYNMWGDNTIVATCVKTATMLGEAAVNCDKVLFLSDLSFLLTPYEYVKILKVLKSMTIIVRSDKHRSIMKSLFNVDPFVVNSFSVQEIENAVRSRKQRQAN